MIISGSSSTPNVSQGGDEQIMYSMTEDDHHEGVSSQSNSSSLFCSLSVLKEKVDQIHSLVSILLSPYDQTHPESTTSIAIASMSNVIHELIVTASSMMFTCQQILDLIGSFSGTETVGGNYSTSTSAPNTCNMKENNTSSFSHGISVINRVEVEGKAAIPIHDHHHDIVEGDGKQGSSPKNNYDIIELDAADLLAKYTHYCQVCGKGFKRDANLRMHMRAHGDEYKTSAALSNPMKKHSAGSNAMDPLDFGMKLSIRKLYSCPQEGCRWNQRHAQFQPLKSMICVKNHYKRCHCPKMYACKRCNRKQFSVLSDLRTHEKHCGDLRWECSCGTTFARKDKLMSHVVLFTGDHSPMLNHSSSQIRATI